MKFFLFLERQFDKNSVYKRKSYSHLIANWIINETELGISDCFPGGNLISLKKEGGVRWKWNDKDNFPQKKNQSIEQFFYCHLNLEKKFN